MRSSVNILTDISQAAVVIGERFPAAGYLGGGTGWHTVQIVTSALVGRVAIEATLTLNPTVGDWFAVRLGTLPYAEFVGETQSVGYTFRGNYVWVRATLDRRYLLPLMAPVTTLLPTSGLLDRVLLVT